MMERRSADRVSIVIPCYNAGDYLVDAVESALAQNHDDVEVIIVNDGSTDARTVEILETMDWPRTRVIHQANAGPAAARNKAISAATGQYILPLDADDRIGPDYVSEAVQVLAQRPEVGVVYCRAEKFGAETGPWLLPPFNLRELVIDNVVFVTALFRREDWLSVGGYDERLRHGIEDYDFWVKIVSLGKEVVQLDACHFFYRVQQQSRTTSFAQDRAAMARTYADIVRANAPFFLKNMEFIFEHRFGLYDELLHYRSRYADLEVFLTRFPLLRKFFDSLIRVAVASLRTIQKSWRVVTGRPMLGSLGEDEISAGSASAQAVPDQSLPNEAVPHRIESATLENAVWTGEACSLSVPDGGQVIYHPAGQRTMFEGFLVGPGKVPAGQFSFVLKGPDAAYMLRTSTGTMRPDVASYFGIEGLRKAGFKFMSSLEGVPAGTYDVSFYMEDARYFCDSGKKIRVD